MSQHPLGGIISALITPFLADGSLKEEVVPSLVDFELAQGINGFYVGGSTGEAFLQSNAERADYLRIVAEAARGRCTLIAHVGNVGTRDTIELGAVAADAGYNAISAIPPFYYDFSREELVAHYRALADAVDIPLVIYNFAGRSGRLTAADILDLLNHPNVAGVKHTSQDLFQLERFKRIHPAAVVYNGFDEMCLGGLSMGADGAIGTTFNFMGDLFVEMRKAYADKRNDDALALQVRANRVIDALIDVGVFPGTKALLKLLGYDVGECRAPFRKLDADDWKTMESCLRDILGK